MDQNNSLKMKIGEPMKRYISGSIVALLVGLCVCQPTFGASHSSDLPIPIDIDVSGSAMIEDVPYVCQKGRLD